MSYNFWIKFYASPLEGQDKFFLSPQAYVFIYI